MLTSDPPNQETPHAQRTVLDQLKQSSLKAAGYSYLIGDAALFASGMMAGRSKEASSGLIYALGGLACAKYGNPNADKQLQLLSASLGDYLERQGIEVPITPETMSLRHSNNIIEQTEHFLYRHPSEVLNAIFALGGAQLTRSGIQHGKGWDTASGAFTTAGGLLGLLISEKKSNPANPPTNAISKAWNWVQEKPLRITGGLYMLNNFTLTMGALKEMQTNPSQKSYLFKFLTAGSYIFANAMLALSSKDNINGDNENGPTLDKLANSSAAVIASQPQEIQDVLVANIAGFVAGQPGTAIKAKEFAEILHKKLDDVKNISADTWTNRVQKSNSTIPTPAL